MSATDSNPWQREGVSILPRELHSLMPIVGQKRLFERLGKFRDQILSASGQDLAGFFMIIGGWGVGKSRVGHELCLEALSEDVHWILDGEKRRLLEARLQEGILPIFLRYVQVTKGQWGEDLEADSWIPRVTVEALSRLVNLGDDPSKNRSVKNQDRILGLCRKVLEPRGWARHEAGLRQALSLDDPREAARTALEVLKKLNIRHLWIVLDEIEDITDVQRDGLPSNDREHIDQGLLTVIPRVIKSEESRQEFPEVNFLLLCSLAVGDLLRQIRAIERRTGWHELRTNTFADVEAFFLHLRNHRPDVASAIRQYPPGLKEAAFFAANRNFGWFNVIMHHAHENYRGGRVTAPQLLRSFAEAATKGGENSVFDLNAISPWRIESDADYEEVKHAIFSMLPREVGSPDGLTSERGERLLAKRDYGSRERAIFTRIIEVSPPPKHQIMSHMVSCGFQTGTTGTELVLLGEARFDLSLVLESLEAYTIGLPEDRRLAGNLLICEDEGEFIQQVAGLSPYAEQASQFAPYLYGLLTNPRYRVRAPDGQERHFVAPAFSFLVQFNRLNKVRQEDEGFLRDSTRNTRLQEQFAQTTKDPGARVLALLRGLANCWEGELAPVEGAPVAGLKLPSFRWTATQKPLNLSVEANATVLYGTGATDHDLEQDLRRIAQEPAEPVVLLLEDQDQRPVELQAWIDRVAPKIAPFVAVHNIARLTGDHLVRLGLMGIAFDANDLRTSHFHGVVGRAKEHLRRTLDAWLESSIEPRGLLLRPLFYGTKLEDDTIQAFARGYGAMIDGATYDDLMQATSPELEAAEKDQFRKVVERQIDPGPKFEELPMTRLVADQSGERVAQIPRELLSVARRCSPGVPCRLRDLEGSFLFDIRNRKGELIQKNQHREVIRQLARVLVSLELLQDEDDKVVRTSVHQLTQHVRAATGWLEGEYAQQATKIRRIHESAGNDLLNVRGKDAKQRLSASSKQLESLKLDFIDRPWEELNRQSGDAMPVFEQRMRQAVHSLRNVHKQVRWVYDPQAMQLFRYRPEVLHQFDVSEKLPSYQLWKRLEVLRGFYEDLEGRRGKLIGRITALVQDVTEHVPAVPAGEFEGQKAFPIQALTDPLDLYRQELSFASENPEKTIAAGTTTLGVTTVGYKLASGKYSEALDRLEFIRQELEEPGKLALSFVEALELWNRLRSDVLDAERQLRDLEGFFAGASSSVLKTIGLESLQTMIRDLRAVFLEGGIRQGTDDREASGVRVNLLTAGLWEDLKKVRNHPQQVQERLRTVKQSILPSLQAKYGDEHRARLSALAKIRKAKNSPLPQWPDQLGPTYLDTVASFERLVERIDIEGREYFEGAGETTFDVFVGLCDAMLRNKPIDWRAEDNKRHVDALMQRSLLELRLV